MDFNQGEKVAKKGIVRLSVERSKLKVISCSEQDLEAHVRRLEAIEKASGNCLWSKE